MVLGVSKVDWTTTCELCRPAWGDGVRDSALDEGLYGAYPQDSRGNGEDTLRVCVVPRLQGYLAHKKERPPMTLR